MIDNKTIRQVVINKALLPCTPGAEVTREASGSGSSDRAVFSCNLIKPLESLIFTLEPQQEGSGDPSPDNPRPILGESEIKFFTRYGDPSSYTIPLTVTVYGGYVNEKGEVWATHGVVTFDGNAEETWASYSSQNGFTKNIPTMKSGSSMQDGKSNFLATIATYTGFGIRFGGNNNSTIYLCHITDNISGVTDVASWKTYLQSNNLQVCYPLATPVKIATIDPIVINTNKGPNEMWTRGDIPFTLKYKYTEGGSCELSKQFLPIFYPNGKGVKHHGSTF